MIPGREEISNLIVPVCLSSSHAAYGSLRMEPVFMALGQAAGVASYLAVRDQTNVQDVRASAIQKQLRENPLPQREIPRQYSKILPFRG